MIRSTVVFSLLLVAGCRDNGVKDEKPPVKVEQPPPAGIQEVWMQIDGMSKALNITGLDGTNKIQKALSELSGVRSAEQLTQLESPLDIIHIQYDPSTVSIETLLQTAERNPEKLKAKIVPAPKKEGRMRTLWKSILACCTFGLFATACTKTDAPPAPTAPTDVVLKVPGMFGESGGPGRVRKALATLPWVEQDSIDTKVETREVMFNLKDKSAWDEQAVRAALKERNFPEMTVTRAPGYLASRGP